MACVVISSFSVAFFAYLPFLEKLSEVNIKEAGQFLDSLPGRNVEVFTLTPENPVVNPSLSVPLLDLFTQKKILYNGQSVLTHGEREKIENSALRFTLEYKNPSYYSSGKYTDEDTFLAVISESAGDPLPAEIERRVAGTPVGVFNKYEGIFHYRTSVRIFRKSNGAR